MVAKKCTSITVSRCDNWAERPKQSKLEPLTQFLVASSSHNGLDQWQSRSWLPNSLQFAKLATDPTAPLLQRIESQDITLIPNIASIGVIFILKIFRKSPLCQNVWSHDMPNFKLFFGSSSKVSEFSICVEPLCKALAKFYEHRTATPISSLPSLKCALLVFICNKYFGAILFTRNRYFCDKPQIPWEHWHFLPSNLTKLLFVTSPITCLCHF